MMFEHSNTITQFVQATGLTNYFIMVTNIMKVVEVQGDYNVCK